MGKAFTDFALQTGQSALGQAMGLVVGGIQNKRQLKQQGKLQAQEIQGQKQMIDYEQMKQLQMWKDTNYGAQMEQLTKAGLNPGLIYGMGGGGGTTTGQTSGNVTGGHAQGSTGTEAITMGTTMAQMGLLRAQKELIEAQKNKEIATTPGEGQTSAKIEAETTSILQGVENAKAQQKLTELQTAIGNVQLDFDKGTLENRKSTINLILSKLIEETKIMENERIISDRTIQTKIGLLRQELALKVLEGYKTRAETRKIREETLAIINSVKMAIQNNMREWDKMDQEQQRIALDKARTMGTYDDPELKDILDNILVIPNFGRGGTTPVKGFHKR